MSASIVESGSLRGMSRWNRALSFGFCGPFEGREQILLDTTISFSNRLQPRHS